MDVGFAVGNSSFEYHYQMSLMEPTEHIIIYITRNIVVSIIELFINFVVTLFEFCFVLSFLPMAYDSRALMMSRVKNPNSKTEHVLPMCQDK